MANFVFVVDQNRIPHNPVHPGQARRLLTEGKAAVLRRYPFTLILKEAALLHPVEPIQIKIDPGSRTTGIALVQGAKVLIGIEITHRGEGIKHALESRSALRRGRRNRKTRYRASRSLNRRRPVGWLAPSVRHRVHTTLTWVKRLCRFAPVSKIAMELVRFDTQALQHPQIQGTHYPQGTLLGFEVREYLLEKWNRKCAYCGNEGVPLEIEHILAKSQGGSDRISNLCLACHDCNQRKGNLAVEAFLEGKPQVLERILRQAKAPLKDAAAVNATRWQLKESLEALGLPLSLGTGGRTKWNRTRLGLEKAHWIDAACVGEVDTLAMRTSLPLRVRCVGHGTRQMCRTDKFGFPNRHKTRPNLHFGFQTGDIVRAVVPQGKKMGTYVGKVACRATGSFNLSTPAGLVQGVGYKNCHLLHHKDGYAY